MCSGLRVGLPYFFCIIELRANDIRLTWGQMLGDL
jgi:hypothetical protein